jgi:RNA polymerase sigma-70 factor (ECF subfamily)
MDALRLRQHRAYVGPWLPSPVDTGDAASASPLDDDGGEVRYDEVESLTLPFLLALEMLSPRQRAVLVLRSVFRCAVADTAQALDLTFGTVKTTLQQANRAMAAYEARRIRPTPDRQREVARTLRQLLERIQAFDTAGVAAMLSPSARALSDAGGEFVAPTLPVVGRERITKLLLKLAERGGPTRFAFRMLNGLPALLAEVAAPAAWAQRFVFQIDVNADGRVDELHTILATRKLAAVRFEPA